MPDFPVDIFLYFHLPKHHRDHDGDTDDQYRIKGDGLQVITLSEFLEYKSEGLDDRLRETEQIVRNQINDKSAADRQVKKGENSGP